MNAYVVDEKNKVIEMRGNITKKYLADGYRLVMAFDKAMPADKQGGAEYPEGATIPATSILTAQQLKAILGVTKAHVLNCYLAVNG